VAKRKQRPIDVKDVVWSHIGKDELDKAAETMWEVLRNGDVIFEYGSINAAYPYHILSSPEQEIVQRAVLAILGTTVPAMLRERARNYPETGDNLTDLADDLEDEHGI
jgi:hypothetical protein